MLRGVRLGNKREWGVGPIGCWAEGSSGGRRDGREDDK